MLLFARHHGRYSHLLDSLVNFRELIRELAAEIRRIDRLEEKGAISERAAGIEREKLERKKELVEAGLTVGGKEKK